LEFSSVMKNSFHSHCSIDISLFSVLLLGNFSSIRYNNQEETVMKKTLALLLALTMVLSLAACGSTKKEEKTETPAAAAEAPAAETTTVEPAAAAVPQIANIFYGGGTPQTIDPALNSASSGSNVIKLAFAGLMGFQWVDGEAKLAPELAESYEVSEDGCTYVFTLREGLKWSDGTDLTLQQIADSWNRAGSAELGADYGFLYDYIERNEDGTLNLTIDEAARTFTVKLAAPTAYFLDLCAFPTFYPVRTDVTDNEGMWATDPAKYIGTGAFRMTSYKVDDVITFEKNPYYWNAENVTLEAANCYLSEDNVAILTAYENGTACFINAIDPVEYDRLYATYPGELVMGDYIGTYYILFNVYKDYSPAGKQLSVQEQRKACFAIGQMVNRDELVNYVTMGGQAPATGFYPNGLADGYNANVRAAADYGSWYTGTNTPAAENADYTEDQVAAVKTLIDLGYAYTGTIEEGNITFTDFPSVEFAFNNSGANAAIIQYVQETWNKFGITATINQEAWATLQTKLKAGDAEAARMGWIADFNDCVNFLEIFICASGNNYPRLGRDIGDYTRSSDLTKDAGLGAYYGENGDQTWAEAYDAVVDQIKSCTDPAERAALCAQAEKTLMATGAVAPLYYYTNPYMLKPNVKGLIMMATGDVVWNYVTIE